MLQHGRLVRFDDGVSMTVRKPLELPPTEARAFVKDMKAFFAEEDGNKQDAIAVRQLRALREH